MTIIGIDPGTNGGIAWTYGKSVAYEKIPETIKDLFELFTDIVMDRDGDCRAYLEQVHSSPQMGVKSAFTFGNGFGHLEMGLTAAGISFSRIRPQVWQKDMGCMTKGDKNVSKRKAQELFPDIKITHATADALLIMSYGLKQQAK
jgi:hypothetical protein